MPVGILLWTAITHADVEITIRPEFKPAAVVKLGGDFKFQDLSRCTPTYPGSWTFRKSGLENEIPSNDVSVVA